LSKKGPKNIKSARKNWGKTCRRKLQITEGKVGGGPPRGVRNGGSIPDQSFWGGSDFQGKRLEPGSPGPKTTVRRELLLKVAWGDPYKGKETGAVSLSFRFKGRSH